MLTLACYNPAVKMEDWNDYKAPKPSLLDGDYCMDTTENDDEQFIPYSLRLLLEQKKKEEQLKSIRELHGNKE